MRVRERVAAVPDSFRLTVSETLRRTSEGSSGEPPVPEPLAVSRVPVLAGPEPLSAEFCGLPQPLSSSRNAARAARSPWVGVLAHGPSFVGMVQKNGMPRKTSLKKTVDSPQRSQRKII